MANRSCGRNRQVRSSAKTPESATFTEPEMRRWPHPVDGIEPASTSSGAFQQHHSSRQADALLHYVHCALSYQNQLLADIKALLEQMNLDTTQAGTEK